MARESFEHTDEVIGTISQLVSRLTRSQAGRLLLTGIICLLVGAEAFARTQGIGFGTGLYWAVTTATTVGYGDVTPQNTAGRVVASLVMLTTIPLFASAFATFAGAVASAHLRRLLGVDDHDPSGREVVIFGMHPAVPGAARELLNAGREVVVVTKADRGALPYEVKVIAADPTSEEGVRKARPDKASQVLIAGSDDADVLVSAVLVHRLAPQTPMLAVASSHGVCEALRELGVETAVSGDELLSHALAKSLEAPHAGELLMRIMDSDGFRLREVPVEDSAIGKALSVLRDDASGLVLGIVHGGKVMVGVGADPVLESGDRLLLLAPDSPR